MGHRLSVSLLTIQIACSREKPAKDAIITDISMLTDHVVALQATVDAQAATIEALRAQLASNDANNAAALAAATSIEDLKADLDTLMTESNAQAERIDSLEDAVSVIDTTGISNLLGVVSVNADGDLVVRGANLYVQSGSGTTNGAVNGKGNLIVGYDESNGLNSKTGSHNLILGRDHTYTSYAGIVAGYNSNANAAYASVLGGTWNVADGEYAVVAGGRSNVARGESSSVSGGWDNNATGSNASILGGYQNTASGGTSGSICGGWANEVTGSNAAILGGHENVASGGSSTVYGGRSQSAGTSYVYAP